MSRPQPAASGPDDELLTVFDGDALVDPRRRGGGPVLIRSERAVGPGAGSVSRTVRLSIDLRQLAPGPDRSCEMTTTQARPTAVAR